jgi:ATP-binding cassette subfamily F protein 2
MSRWKEKQVAKAEEALERELQSKGNNFSEGLVAQDLRAAAMGKGEEELFEKKLSKEEKKALAKARREAKKKTKKSDSKVSDDGDDDEDEKKVEPEEYVAPAAPKDESGFEGMSLKERKREEALEKLSQDQIIVTYESRSTKLHANSRDINVGGVSLTFHGKPLLEETEIVINYGNRYGFIGPNGSGKSTLMKAIAARAIPIPEAIDIYFLDGEYEACDKTALEAVFEVQDEVHELEQRIERLNHTLADAGAGGDEELINSIQGDLEMAYEKLDAMDVDTAEARASQILFGLGFTTKMQQMKTREFSGGWRMRIALARALFLKPGTIHVKRC